MQYSLLVESVYTVPEKRPPFIFWIILSKLTDFNDFWHVKSWKNWHEMLQICPPHLSDVTIVPWEIQKSHIQRYYSYIILIIYAIWEENKP